MSHSCHVDKLSVPIFSAPRKDTSGISDPKITLELLFSNSTLDNLRSASQKKGLEKERWHFVVTLTVTHLRQLHNFRISTSQNIHKSCDFQTESRFILFSTFCSSAAAQRPQKVKCVVRLWHQVVHCVHQLA